LKSFWAFVLVLMGCCVLFGSLAQHSPGFRVGMYQYGEVPGSQALVAQRLSEGYALVGQGSLEGLRDHGFYIHLTDLDVIEKQPEFQYLMMERLNPLDEVSFGPMEQDALKQFTLQALVKLERIENIAKLEIVSYTREEARDNRLPVHRFRLALSHNNHYMQPALLILLPISHDRQWIILCGSSQIGQLSKESFSAKDYSKQFEMDYKHLEVKARKALSRAQGNLEGF
jgi:hypothetical protein